MEITREMIKENTVFHCDTEDKAIEFWKKLSDLGYKWWNGESYLDYNKYSNYEEDTCYHPCIGAYSNISFCKNENYKIIEYELDKKEFAMDDIKDGYLIELRNGDKYLCCSDNTDEKIFVNDEKKVIYYSQYSNFDVNTKTSDLLDYDIVKVYGRSSKQTCLLSLKIDYRELLWERKEVNKMELNDTVEMMNSEDFKERFKAEYIQTKTRYDKLDEMTVKYEAGTLTFKPSCSLELLKEQKKHMNGYIRCLQIRAEIEHIDLS